MGETFKTLIVGDDLTNDSSHSGLLHCSASPWGKSGLRLIEVGFPGKQKILSLSYGTNKFR